MRRGVIDLEKAISCVSRNSWEWQYTVCLHLGKIREILKLKEAKLKRKQWSLIIWSDAQETQERAMYHLTWIKETRAPSWNKTWEGRCVYPWHHVECRLSGGAGAWVGAGGRPLPTRYSWAHLHAQHWLLNQTLGEGLDSILFQNYPGCEGVGVLMSSQLSTTVLEYCPENEVAPRSLQVAERRALITVCAYAFNTIQPYWSLWVEP